MGAGDRRKHRRPGARAAERVSCRQGSRASLPAGKPHRSAADARLCPPRTVAVRRGERRPPATGLGPCRNRPLAGARARVSGSFRRARGVESIRYFKTNPFRHKSNLGRMLRHFYTIRPRAGHGWDQDRTRIVCLPAWPARRRATANRLRLPGRSRVGLCPLPCVSGQDAL